MRSAASRLGERKRPPEDNLQADPKANALHVFGPSRDNARRRSSSQRAKLTMKPSPSSYVVLVRFGRLQSAFQNPQSRPIHELDDAHIGHMALAVPSGPRRSMRSFRR